MNRASKLQEEVSFMPEHAKGIIKKLIWGLIGVLVVATIVFVLVDLTPPTQIG